MTLLSDVLLNLFTELIGIGITFLLIERWIDRREEKRRKPQKESLLQQIYSMYYVIGVRFRNLLRSIVYACVDNDIQWVTGGLVPIERVVSDLNKMDNLAQDLLPYEVRNEFLQINSSIEIQISTLKHYEDFPLTEEKAIMEIMGLTLLIEEIVNFIARNTEQDYYDLNEITVPLLSRREARNFFNQTREDSIRSKEILSQYKKNGTIE